MKHNRLLWLLSLSCLISSIFLAQTTRATKPVSNIHELEQQDQADQRIEHAQQKFPERYRQREQEVKRFMQSGAIHTPQDFFDAGVILTHSHEAANQLLAHLAFTAAAFGGINEAKHYAATSLDRYLIDSNQAPAFGTIYWAPSENTWRHDVSPAMNDAIRAAFCVRPLEELNKDFEREKRGGEWTDPAHDSFWDYKREGCH